MLLGDFDWNQVLMKGLIGGIIGGLVGLVMYFVKKAKGTDQQETDEDGQKKSRRDK